MNIKEKKGGEKKLRFSTNGDFSYKGRTQQGHLQLQSNFAER